MLFLRLSREYRESFVYYSEMDKGGVGNFSGLQEFVDIWVGAFFRNVWEWAIFIRD